MPKGSLRGVLAFAALLVFVLAAAAQEAATIYGLSVPAQVDRLTRGPPIDYESKSPGLGYAFRFSGRAGWTVDVYIYDFQLKTIPADLNSGVMLDQFKRAQNDILALGERGLYANVQATGKFEVARAGKPAFHCATFSYLRGEKRDIDVDSFLCLTTWNDKFVKFRMTGVKGSIARDDAVSFLTAWIPLLWPK
jgi:hypothetical protein